MTWLLITVSIDYTSCLIKLLRLNLWTFGKVMFSSCAQLITKHSKHLRPVLQQHTRFESYARKERLAINLIDFDLMINFITFTETNYLKTDTCKSESSQSHKSRTALQIPRKLAANLLLLNVVLCQWEPFLQSASLLILFSTTDKRSFKVST